MTGRRPKIRCSITHNTIIFIRVLGILLVFIDVVDTRVTGVGDMRVSIKACCGITHWLYCGFNIGVRIFS